MAYFCGVPQMSINAQSAKRERTVTDRARLERAGGGGETQIRVGTIIRLPTGAQSMLK